MSEPDSLELHVVDAGMMPYRAAWDLQLKLVDEVLAGEHPRGALVLVEHPPVVTIGRRAGASGHLLASPRMLEMRGVEVVETDRGGDITFHGPGQLVAYPILPLNAYGLNLHAYLRLLEQAVIEALGRFLIPAFRDTAAEPATGVWTFRPGTSYAREPTARPAPESLAKICAVGIKVRRWTSFHGIALNVTTDLSFFELINPCGLSRPVTSVAAVLQPAIPPPMSAVKGALRGALGALLAERYTGRK
jgi:lipoate-protein ligase B